MAIVVKRSVTGREELINGNKLDWSSMGYTYKTTQTANFNSPATAYTHYFPTSWDMEFDAVIGATYRIEAYTSYLELNQAEELDFGIEIVSGATSLATVNDFQTGAQLARGRTIHLIAKATSQTVSVRCWVGSGATNAPIRIYGGAIESQRVA